MTVLRSQRAQGRHTRRGGTGWWIFVTDPDGDELRLHYYDDEVVEVCR